MVRIENQEHNLLLEVGEDFLSTLVSHKIYILEKESKEKYAEEQAPQRTGHKIENSSTSVSHWVFSLNSALIAFSTNLLSSILATCLNHF